MSLFLCFSFSFPYSLSKNQVTMGRKKNNKVYNFPGFCGAGIGRAQLGGSSGIAHKFNASVALPPHDSSLSMSFLALQMSSLYLSAA